MESMSVLERLSELLPALPPGLIEAWGQLVLFAVPVWLSFCLLWCSTD